MTVKERAMEHMAKTGNFISDIVTTVVPKSDRQRVHHARLLGLEEGLAIALANPEAGTRLLDMVTENDWTSTGPGDFYKDSRDTMVKKWCSVLAEA